MKDHSRGPPSHLVVDDSGALGRVAVILHQPDMGQSRQRLRHIYFLYGSPLRPAVAPQPAMWEPLAVNEARRPEDKEPLPAPGPCTYQPMAPAAAPPATHPPARPPTHHPPAHRFLSSTAAASLSDTCLSAAACCCDAPCGTVLLGPAPAAASPAGCSCACCGAVAAEEGPAASPAPAAAGCTAVPSA